MGNLKKNFSSLFDGKIWNIESELQGAYLVIEIRREDDLTASFFTYEPVSHELIQCDLQFEDSWWVGVSNVAGNIIVFHQFLDQENPQEKGFIAFDVDQKKVIWEKTDVSLWSFGQDHILASRQGNDITINITSGAEEAGGNNIETSKNNYIRYPFHYQPGSDYYATVSKFLAHVGINSDHQYGVDYLEKEGFVVISYYSNENGLTNKLLVVDSSKNIVLDETLGQQLNGIADRPFFVYHDNLIFVRDNSDFLSYQLSQ